MDYILPTIVYSCSSTVVDFSVDGHAKKICLNQTGLSWEKHVQYFDILLFWDREVGISYMCTAVHWGGERIRPVVWTTVFDPFICFLSPDSLDNLRTAHTLQSCVARGLQKVARLSNESKAFVLTDVNIARRETYPAWYRTHMWGIALFGVFLCVIYVI